MVIKKIALLLLVVLVVCTVAEANIGDLSKVKITSGWQIIHSTDTTDYEVIIDDPLVQTTEICLVKKNAKSINDVPIDIDVVSSKDEYKEYKDDLKEYEKPAKEKEKPKDGEGEEPSTVEKVKPGTEIKATKEEKIKDGKTYYGYCYTITDEKFVKFGTNSTIVEYQDENKLAYDLDWAQFNITLYKKIGDTWDNTVNDVWVTYNSSTWKFGANDSSNNGVEQYMYVVESNVPIKNNLMMPYIYKDVEKNVQERHTIDFRDICLSDNISGLGISASCSFSYTTIPVLVDDNSTDAYARSYVTSVVFYSGESIDPLITLTNAQVFGDVIYDNVRNISDGFSELELNSTTMEGLVGYYNFNSDTPSVSYDLSERANHGTVTNAVSKEGYFGKGMYFDGNGDYVQFNALNAYKNTTINYTLIAWFKADKIDSATYAHRMITLNRLDGNSYAALYCDQSGQVGFGFAENDCTTFKPYKISNVVLNTWYFVATTYNGSHTKGFINGVLKNTSTSTHCHAIKSEAYIGKKMGTTNHFNGTIDEVMLFNRSLSLAEIQAIYGNTSKRYVERGTQSLKSQQLADTNYRSVNVSFDDWQTVKDSNISVRLGSWNENLGYKNYDMDTGYVVFGGVNSAMYRDVDANYNGPNVTINAWVYFAQNKTGPIIVRKQHASTPYYSWSFRVYGYKLQFYMRNNTNTTYLNYPYNYKLNTWHMLSGVINSSHLIGYWDGIYIGSQRYYGTPFAATSDLKFGRDYSAPDTLNGSLDDISVYTDVLSSAEIDELYKRGRGSQMLYHPSLAGYWSFDAKNGNTDVGIYDMTTVTGVAYTSDENDYAKFDGTNDNISLSTLYDPNVSSRYFTVSVWTNVKSVSADMSFIGRRGLNDNDQFGLKGDSDGSGVFKVFAQALPSGTRYTLANTPAGTWKTNQWQNMVAVFNRTKIFVYVDGVLANTTVWDGLVAKNDIEGCIGNSHSSNEDVNGKIDAIMLWNRSLTASEIEQIFELGRDISSYDDDALYHKFQFENPTFVIDDEKHTGATMLGNTKVVSDYSGLTAAWHFDGNLQDDVGNLDGTASGEVSSITNGVFGGAYNITGSTGKITIGDYQLVSNAISISLWVKKTANLTTQSYIFSKWLAGAGGREYTLMYDSGSADTLGWIIGTSTGSAFNFAKYPNGNGLMPIGVWTHILATREGNYTTLYVDGEAKTKTMSNISATDFYSSATSIVIGNNQVGDKWFNGAIDEVYLFNRSISTAEAKDMYFRGRNNWNITEQVVKENAGTYDYVGSSGIESCYFFNDFTDSCENDDATQVSGIPLTSPGVLNKGSVLFSGSAPDYAALPSQADVFYNGSYSTISMWVYAFGNNSGSSNDGTYMNVGYYATNPNGYVLSYSHNNNAMKIYSASPVGFNYETANTFYPYNWYHVVAVQRGYNINVYMNGKNLTAFKYVKKYNSSKFCIGDECGAKAFSGYIDEVAIWSRNLSSAEVEELYVKSKPKHSMNNFPIDMYTTNLLPELKLTASTNNFYSPVFMASENITMEYVEHVSAPVTLLNPTNNWYVNSSNIMLQCRAFDPEGHLEYVDFYTNYTGVWANHRTANGGENVSVQYNISVFNTEKTFIWNCRSRDTSGNVDWGTSNRTLRVDNTPVSVDMMVDNRTGTSSFSAVVGDTSNNVSAFFDYKNSPDLLLWARFEDNWNDSSTYRNGVYAPTNNPRITTGFRGHAYLGYKNDTNVQKAAFDNHARFKVGKNFSMSIWANYLGNDQNDNQGLFGMQDTTGCGSSLHPYMLATNWGEEVYFYVKNTTNSKSTGIYDLKNKGWTHIVGVHNGTHILMYINGAVYGTPTRVVGFNVCTTPSAQLAIGRVAENFNGSLDEAMLWNRSLTAEEVKSLYNAQKYPLFKNIAESGEVRLYSVDQAGNAKVQVVNVTYDSASPVITNLSSLVDHADNMKTYTFSFNTTDSSGTYSFADYNNSLVAWYRLENNGLDYLGRKNATTFSNILPITGKFGTAADFNGKSSQINTGQAHIHGWEEYSVFGWIYPERADSYKDTDNNYYSHVFGSLGWSSPNILGIGFRKSNHTLMCANSNVMTGFFTNPAYTNKWNHIGYVHNGTRLKYYINGNYVGGITTIYNTTYQFKIGYNSNLNSGQSYFNGSIDDIIVFNRSLTLAEIKALYNASVNDYTLTYNSSMLAESLNVYSVDTAGNLQNELLMIGVQAGNSLSTGGASAGLAVKEKIKISVSPASFYFDVNKSKTHSGTLVVSSSEPLPVKVSMNADSGVDLSTRNFVLSNGQSKSVTFLLDVGNSLNGTKNLYLSYTKDSNTHESAQVLISYGIIDYNDNSPDTSSDSDDKTIVEKIVDAKDAAIELLKSSSKARAVSGVVVVLLFVGAAALVSFALRK